MDDLTAIFNLLKNQCPALAATSPVGMGTFGIVTDHHDGTVSKTLLRWPDEQKQQQAESFLANEHTYLNLLENMPFGTSIPKVLSPIESLDESETFFATYRMTKLPGKSPAGRIWRYGEEEAQEKFYKQAGILLASFHKRAIHFAEGCAIEKSEVGANILQVEDFSPQMNSILKSANEELQNRMPKETVLIHGDYKEENMLADEEMNITGLFDFSLTKPTRNFYRDLMSIPTNTIMYVVEGYEQEYEQRLDPMMMVLTIISEHTHTMNEPKIDSVRRGLTKIALEDSLEMLCEL